MWRVRKKIHKHNLERISERNKESQDKTISQKPREKRMTACCTLERIPSFKIRIRLTINISLANLIGAV